jgi:hypothetical protein
VTSAGSRVLRRCLARHEGLATVCVRALRGQLILERVFKGTYHKHTLPPAYSYVPGDFLQRGFAMSSVTTGMYACSEVWKAWGNARHTGHCRPCYVTNTKVLEPISYTRRLPEQRTRQTEYDVRETPD